MIDDDEEPGQPADAAAERGAGPAEPAAAAVQREAAAAPVLVVCQDTFTAGQVPGWQWVWVWGGSARLASRAAMA